MIKSNISKRFWRVFATFVCFFLFFPKVLCADIYSWIGADGIKHFTNKKTEVENVSRASAIVQSDEVEFDLQSDIVQQQKYKLWRLQKGSESNGFQLKQTSEYNDIDFIAKTKEKSNRFRIVSDGIYEVGGYEINVTGYQRGERLQIRGRVSYGPHCGLLRIGIKLKNRDGNTVYVVSKVKGVGGANSSVIREEKQLRRAEDKIADTWHVINMTVACEAE